MELCLRFVGLSLFSSTRESTLDNEFSAAAAMVGIASEGFGDATESLRDSIEQGGLRAGE